LGLRLFKLHKSIPIVPKNK